MVTMAESKSWPSWRYGPNGESRIFQKDDQVPKGWEDHPDKVKQPAKSTGKQPVQGAGNQPPTPEPTPEEKLETIRSIREAAAADNIDITLADDASVDEINAAIDKLTKR
jgi:hypothetical protein